MPLPTRCTPSEVYISAVPVQLLRLFIMLWQSLAQCWPIHLAGAAFGIILHARVSIEEGV